MLNPLLMEKLSKIRLLVLDVDGVMTDGRIIINDLGQESKFFNVRDGHGLKVLMRYDVDVVLLTGRQSAVVEYRAQELGIGEIHQKVWNKLEVYEEILSRRGLTDEEVAFVGDDIIDIPVLRRVGFSATVADATEEARQAADYITVYDGGRGAVREICDLILKAKGHWPDVAKKYQFSYGI
ncbi:MAG: 3-deoxy-D-manno-octulosonate 8-phosphate phosphatase KdsC [Syntrophus sp. SKADARSKE-3]|nr:3-deoxy-D-manno-octulosonate 8-phosphate phosphatase KdsC [Syntrophus sp. SKADARSKE-3]